MKKISFIVLLYFIIGCTNKYYVSNNTDNSYFIGRGSSIKSYDIDKSYREAKLRALNDLILQIKANVKSENSVYNNQYFENIEVKSDVIVRRWKESKTWEKDGYIWSEVILNKNDYYESVEEYKEDIKNKIRYNIDMTKYGTIRKRLEFYLRALELSEKFDKNLFNIIVKDAQDFIDNIRVIPKIDCFNLSCISSEIYIGDNIDSSLFIEWHIKDDKFSGSFIIDNLKVKLFNYGIVFSNIIVEKIDSTLSINNGNRESYLTPKIRIDTIYHMKDNKIICNNIQIADTLTLRNSKFFIRKRINGNYALFNGIRQSNSKLSLFILPKDKKPLDFIKIKFYKEVSNDLNNDIEEIYFDDNYIYVDNIIKIYYINNNGEWEFMDMVKNSLSQLTVLSEPNRAQVFINNRYVGETPYYLSDPLEPYAVITIKKNGFYSLEYFTSLFNNSAITKKFVLRKMPELKYGTYIDQNVYYAEDKSSADNLDSMINFISEKVKLLESKYRYMSNDIYELYDISRFLNRYREDLKKRIYCQYIPINKKIVLNRTNQIKDTLCGLKLDGYFDIVPYEIEDINLNIEQCFLKLEYRKESGECYKYFALSLLYGTKEYRFNGKYSF